MEIKGFMISYIHFVLILRIQEEILVVHWPRNVNIWLLFSWEMQCIMISISSACFSTYYEFYQNFPALPWSHEIQVMIKTNLSMPALSLYMISMYFPRIRIYVY